MEPKIYIFAGIDGTGSAEWGKASRYQSSHVHKFYEDFPSEHKKYFDGPDGAGMNVGDIIDSVVAFFYAVLRKEIPKYMENIRHIETVKEITDLNSHFKKRTKEVLWEEAIEKDRRKLENRIEFFLVGHSRGGVIATEVARRLPKKVKFLGLYDSVDRAAKMLESKVQNVDITYHARRASFSKMGLLPNFLHDESNNPIIVSRPSFYNDNISSDGTYKEKIFHTQHGGIGGDLNLKDFTVTGDNSLVILTLNSVQHCQENFDMVQKQIMAISEAKQADMFIRAGLRETGINIPYNHYAYLNNQLQERISEKHKIRDLISKFRY